jgi:hypothetical protein
MYMDPEPAYATLPSAVPRTGTIDRLVEVTALALAGRLTDDPETKTGSAKQCKNLHTE